MAGITDERSRALGGMLCVATVAAGALFLYGIAVRSYWALALPLLAAVLFVLGLVFWIGWTIATVRADAEGKGLAPSGGGPGSATTPEVDSAARSDPDRSGN